MKKVILFAAIFALILAFVGCSAKFDTDEAIEKLREQGLTLSTVYTTERELSDGTSLANAEVRMMGGDFTVELRGYSSLIQKGDPSKNCQIFTFATQEQASAYADLYVTSRWEGSAWKVAQSDCVVILTNLEVAQQTINLDFK